METKTGCTLFLSYLNAHKFIQSDFAELKLNRFALAVINFRQLSPKPKLNSALTLESLEGKSTKIELHVCTLRLCHSLPIYYIQCHWQIFQKRLNLYTNSV